MHDSLWEQATESDWSREEREQWYRERPRDKEYYEIQRELLKDGLTRKVKLTQLPPHEEGQPTLWAIGVDGASPLRLPEAEQYFLHVSLAFDDEEREVTLQFYRFTSGGTGELSLKWDPVANSESVQRARQNSSYSHRPLHISF